MEDLKKWDNYSVSKTPEVLDIIKYDLPLECFKIVDIYLSKINPQGIRDIEKEYFDKIAALPKDFEDEKLKEKIFSEYLQERYMKIRRWALVSLDKEDFCTLTGKNPKSFRKRDIDNLLKKICGLCLTYEMPDGKTATAPFFQKAIYDPENAQLQLICAYEDEMIRPIFFDIGNFRYLQYKLKLIRPLKTIAAYKILMLLLKKRPYIPGQKNPDGWTFMISVAELRTVIGYESKNTDFCDLKNRVLDRAKEELAEKTPLSFTYEVRRKKGRTASELSFSVRIAEENSVTGNLTHALPCIENSVSDSEAEALSVPDKASKPISTVFDDPRAAAIIRYLNARGGTSFPDSDETDLIIEWLATINPVTGQTYTVEELKTAIDYKIEEDGDRKWIAPRYIFHKRNFIRYYTQQKDKLNTMTPAERKNYLAEKFISLIKGFIRVWDSCSDPFRKLEIPELWSLSGESDQDIAFAADNFTVEEMECFSRYLRTSFLDRQLNNVRLSRAMMEDDPSNASNECAWVFDALDDMLAESEQVDSDYPDVEELFEKHNWNEADAEMSKSISELKKIRSLAHDISIRQLEKKVAQP